MATPPQLLMTDQAWMTETAVEPNSSYYWLWVLHHGPEVDAQRRRKYDKNTEKIIEYRQRFCKSRHRCHQQSGGGEGLFLPFYCIAFKLHIFRKIMHYMPLKEHIETGKGGLQ